MVCGGVGKEGASGTTPPDAPHLWTNKHRPKRARQTKVKCRGHLPLPPWVEVWGSGSSGVETLRVMLRVTAQSGKIWGISASSCFKYAGVFDTSCNTGGGAPPILSPAKSFPKIRSTPGTGSSATATGHHPQNSPSLSGLELKALYSDSPPKIKLPTLRSFLT